VASGNVSYSFTVQFSTDPTDVDVSDSHKGPLVPGYDYFRVLDDIGLDSYLGHDSGSVFKGSVGPFPPAGGRGDMGVHLPAGATVQVFSKSIGGIGSFPPFAVGDTIDLTGGGWPL
jgi:hypothetical protein